jgi:GMP synthase (glutamine-hydrolysing)
MFERPKALEQALDESSGKIERHLTSLGEAQKNFAEIAKGKSLLLVDTTLGNPARLIQKGLDKLHDQGWEEVAKLYLQKLYGGQPPKNTLKIFQDFLGPEIQLVHQDIRYDKTGAGQIDAAIFTGSPADVSKALANPDAEVREGITHGEVYRRAVEFYREASDENLPVLGICFGHQMISSARGGEMIRQGEVHAKTGIEKITPTEYGADFLAAIQLGEPKNLSGEIAAFHGESVKPNPESSALILRTSDRDPAIVHGLFHVAEKTFSGDPEQDAALISELLKDKKHVALTLQGHPEYTGAADIITFAIKEDPRIFQRTQGRVVTSDMLNMFAKFLKKHGRF